MANVNADKITAFMKKNASKFEYLTKALGDLKVQMDTCYTATQAYLEIMDTVQKTSGVEVAVAQGSMRKAGKKAPVVEDLEDDEDMEELVEDDEEAPPPPKKSKAAAKAAKAAPAPVKKSKKAPVVEDLEDDDDLVEDDDTADEEFDDSDDLEDDEDLDDATDDEDDDYEDVSEEFEDELDEEDDVGDEFEDIFDESEYEEVRPVKGKAAAAAQKANAKSAPKAKAPVSKKR